MAVKLIALDMDGTLMDESHMGVSEENKNALLRAAQQGIHIVLASGRPLALMVDTARALGCVRYLISSNGGNVWDLQEERSLAVRAISAPQAANILSVLTDYPIATEVYCQGKAHVDAHTWTLDQYDKLPPSFLAFRAQCNTAVEDLNLHMAGKDVEKFNVDGITPQVRDAILARLEPLRHGLAVNYIPCYDNLEISRRDATKGTALAALCGVLDIPATAVMAVGDSANDVDMLTWATYSVAMDNGAPAAKAAAQYGTGPFYESGVAQAVERFVFK